MLQELITALVLPKLLKITCYKMAKGRSPKTSSWFWFYSDQHNACPAKIKKSCEGVNPIAKEHCMALINSVWDPAYYSENRNNTCSMMIDDEAITSIAFLNSAGVVYLKLFITIYGLNSQRVTISPVQQRDVRAL